MKSQRKSEAPMHEFFSCPNCKEAGRKVEESVEKITRWSRELVGLGLAAPGEDENAEIREGLAHAIFYEAERLSNDLPGRALCGDEWDRLRDVHQSGGPRAV